MVCPVGILETWARCLSCRHLQAAQDDRDLGAQLLDRAAAHAMVDRIEQPEASWAALVIELL